VAALDLPTHQIRSGARRSGQTFEGIPCDPGGFVHERLGLLDGGVALVRPDTYLAVRTALDDLAPLEQYVNRWLR
jgi:hypothetical protein